MPSPNVILVITDHAADAVAELRAERKELLERAAAIGRQIGTIEAMEILSLEHRGAEANGPQVPK